MRRVIIVMVTVFLFVFGQQVLAQDIMKAVELGDVGEVKLILTDQPDCINQNDEESGFTPLHRAAEKVMRKSVNC